MERFDVAVLGAGPGGYVAAIRAAQLGLRVALVEKRAQLGGTCLNVGCIPSKALLESSELYARAKEGVGEHGVVLGEVRLDLPAMMARKVRIVRELTDGLALLMRKNKIVVIRGHGQFVTPERLAVSSEQGAQTQELEAQHVILAAGSVPIELPFLRFDGKRVVSSTEALELDAVPDHLAVIGAGAVGLELGSVWARLGARVTIIELLPRILPFADPEIGALLRQSLEGQGLRFKLGCRVEAAEVDERAVRLALTQADGQAERLEATHVLVAVGRRAAVEGIGLDRAGVQVEGGKVRVDGRFRTSAPNVFAIGDLIRGPMLAHKAEDEGVAVAEIIAGKPGHVNYDAIPNIVYTWPELATVGASESEARDAGREVRVGRYRFAANGRAKTLGETDGQVKLVADAKTDRLLGAQIVGPRASDLIAELVTAIELSASAEDIARTSHAHPTLSEVIREAALAVDRRVLHG